MFNWFDGLDRRWRQRFHYFFHLSKKRPSANPFTFDRSNGTPYSVYFLKRVLKRLAIHLKYE